MSDDGSSRHESVVVVPVVAVVVVSVAIGDKVGLLVGISVGVAVGPRVGEIVVGSTVGAAVGVVDLSHDPQSRGQMTGPSAVTHIVAASVHTDGSGNPLQSVSVWVVVSVVEVAEGAGVVGGAGVVHSTSHVTGHKSVQCARVHHSSRVKPSLPYKIVSQIV